MADSETQIHTRDGDDAKAVQSACTPSDVIQVEVHEEHHVEVTECDGEIIVDDIVDIEIYVREKKRVPLARAYRIRIDKDYYTVEQPNLTARELLVLASKSPPEKYVLRQIVDGRPIKLELEDVVDFRAPGVEKFKTMLKTAQDGAC